MYFSSLFLALLINQGVSGIPEITTVSGSSETAEVCRDKPDQNCWSRLELSCLGIYEPWAKENCPQRCGLCPDPPPCEDAIDHCYLYEENVCKDSNFRVWAQQNCRKFCGLCSVPNHSHPTTQQPTRPKIDVTKGFTASYDLTQGVCHDNPKEDCWGREDEYCFGIYEPWARGNCPSRCGFCPEPPPCVDNIDNCSIYPFTYCDDPVYRIWTAHNCRKFCNQCKAPIPPSTRAPNGGLTTGK